MSNTALITGASSGIGAEFARYHASKGGDAIIVARRKEPLEALKKDLEAQHGVKITVIAQDVGTPEQVKDLYAKIKKQGHKIDVLINNAGFGGHGAFLDRDLDADLAMVDLNIGALITLSHLVGNDMKTPGGGKMLQVSSTASYMPGPLQATYYATKAFVSSFSYAINEEMKGHGITSTALEPGMVATEFVETADLGGTGMANQKLATPASVAKIGYDAMLAGKRRIINDGSLNFTLNWIFPFVPMSMRLKMISRMQTK